MAQILKRDIPLGEIVASNMQTLYSTVNTTEAVGRGTLLLSTDGGVTFDVVGSEDEDANGVLLDNIETTSKAAVLVTGAVVEDNIIGFREILRSKLFANKILLK